MDDIGNFDLITDFEDLSGLTQADPIPMPTENIVRKRKFDDPVSDAWEFYKSNSFEDQETE